VLTGLTFVLPVLLYLLGSIANWIGP